jgi:hypothetical protein
MSKRLVLSIICGCVAGICFAQDTSLIPSRNMSLHYVDSEELSSPPTYMATNAFDGNPNTFWHTEFVDNVADLPHEIQINLGQTYNVVGVEHLPRQDGYTIGRVREYEIYVSTDGVTWGTPVVADVFANTELPSLITFSPTSGQFLRFRALSEHGPVGSVTTVAELSVLVLHASPEGVIVEPAADTVTITAGDTVQFAGSGSSSEGNTPLSYRWTFGEGAGVPDSLQQNPGPIRFHTPGTYNVVMTVTDSIGLDDPTPATCTVVVQAPTNVVPIPSGDLTLRYVDSQELSSPPTYMATNAFDGNPNTFWHTEFVDNQPELPHEIQINLGGLYNVAGMRHVPRQDGYTVGRVKEHEVYVSTDGFTWGAPVATGTFANTSAQSLVMFSPKPGRFLRFRALSEYGPVGSATTVAELSMFIVPNQATVTLTDLDYVYDGTAWSATAQTEPEGLTVELTYDGSLDAPTNAGIYEVIGTIQELNYVGSATNTLTITAAAAEVTLDNLSQVYDGTGRSAAAQTEPEGLTVELTYDGSLDAPTNAGIYEVIGTIQELNYVGSATNTLTITAAAAEVTLDNLSQVYDGTARSATAQTEPAGLTVELTYDGSLDAPTNAGIYEVIGTIQELNYGGSATNTLTIAAAAAEVLLSDLSQVYDGTGRSATAQTEPEGLTVELTYDGSLEAPTNAGIYEVIGTIQELNYVGSATNTLTIAAAAAEVLLSDLSQVYDGTGRSATAQTEPEGLTVELTYDGSLEAPTNAGIYEVIGTIQELNYAGSATNTLTIAAAAAEVLLSDLSQVYDGTGRSAAAQTEPEGLTVELTYDGSLEAPTNAGTYEVIGTIQELNYAGSATNTLTIAAAAAEVTLGDLTQVYDGTARSATAQTEPEGLTVELTYDGSLEAPTNAGIYEVIGTIQELNYAGSATNTLTIAAAAAEVTLGDLTQVYDGTARSATAQTEPEGLTVELTYDGSLEAPTNAGIYEVIGTIQELNYAGSATNTLTIAAAAAEVLLSDLSQVYDGTGRSVTAQTEPEGLTVELTYDGSLDADERRDL